MKTSALRLGVWSTLLQLSRVGFNALVFVLVSRLVGIDDLGHYSIAFAILQIFLIFIRSGITETVVSAKAESNIFLDTAFRVALLFGFGAFLGMNIVSFITWFLVPSLFDFVAILSVVVLLDAIGVVPDAILRRKLSLRTLATRTFVASGISATFAIYLAMTGFGVWSLIGFNLVNSAIASTFALALCGWLPKSVGRNDLVGDIIGPALRVISSSFASATIIPSAQLIVGIVGGAGAAGAYAIAQRLLGLAANFAIEPARYLALPYLAKLDDRKAQSRAVLDAAAFISAFASPLYLTLFFSSTEILPLLVGDNGYLAQPIFSALAWHFPPLIISMLISQRLIAERRMRDVLVFTSTQATLNIFISLPLAMISAAAVAIGYTARAYILLPLVLYQGARYADIPWKGILLKTFLPIIPAIIATAGAYVLINQLSFAETSLGKIEIIVTRAAVAGPFYLLLLRLLLPSHFKLIFGAIKTALVRK